MSHYKCPHCGASGSTQRKCKFCWTVYCTSCGTTVAGAEIKSGSGSKCAVCETKGGVYFVDYQNRGKCS